MLRPRLCLGMRMRIRGVRAGLVLDFVVGLNGVSLLGMYRVIECFPEFLLDNSDHTPWLLGCATVIGTVLVVRFAMYYVFVDLPGLVRITEVDVSLKAQSYIWRIWHGAAADAKGSPYLPESPHIATNVARYSLI